MGKLMKAVTAKNVMEVKRIIGESKSSKLSGEKIEESEMNTERDTNGNYAIHIAVENKCKDIVDFLLDGGAKIDCVNNNGETPIYIAAKNGLIDLVKILFEGGAKIDLTIDFSLRKGHVNIIKLLLAIKHGFQFPLPSVDCTNKDGETLLYIAAQNGLIEVVKLLLQEGAKITFSKNKTVIHAAVSKNHMAVVKIIHSVSKGPNNGCKSSDDFLSSLEVQDENGDCPIHIAMRNGYTKMVKILLDMEKDLNRANGKAETLLHLAVQNRDAEIFEALLEKNIELGKFNKYGWAAIHLSAQFGAIGFIERFHQLGIDMNCTTAVGGETPLYIASEYNHPKVTEFLTKKANVNKPNKDGNTPLHAAARAGWSNIAEILLESKARVNVLNNEQKTPLHIAVSMSHKDVVGILCRAGANVNQGDAHDKTPLDLAREEHAIEILNILLQYAEPRANSSGNNSKTLKTSASNMMEWMDKVISDIKKMEVTAWSGMEDKVVHIASLLHSEKSKREWTSLSLELATRNNDLELKEKLLTITKKRKS